MAIATPWAGVWLLSGAFVANSGFLFSVCAAVIGSDWVLKVAIWWWSFHIIYGRFYWSPLRQTNSIWSLVRLQKHNTRWHLCSCRLVPQHWLLIFQPRNILCVYFCLSTCIYGLFIFRFFHTFSHSLLFSSSPLPCSDIPFYSTYVCRVSLLLSFIRVLWYVVVE